MTNSGEKTVENTLTCQGDAALEKDPLPVSFKREMSGTFNGVRVNYRAVAGETLIRDEGGLPVASFFTTAYVKIGAEDASRPLMFIFNGGPGSSTQWLHMGAFGPQRVLTQSEPETARAPPYIITENDASTLELCDLVFIDPIGTGYSRSLGRKKTQDFSGLLEDARSVADFIQAWITEHSRWNSPKYLVGESYGTTRAALVADILSTRFVALNGIVLVSAVLDYQNSRPRNGDGGILPYVSFLPSYAATAWYHGRVERGNHSLESFLDEVRTFACTEYAQALIANCRASDTQRSRIASRVAAYAGLAASYVEQSNLRVPVNRYFRELLRDRGRVVGRLDSRYVGTDADGVGELSESDPTLDSIGSSFTSAMHALFAELGVRMERTYEPMRTIEDWNWQLEAKALNGGGYLNVVPHLARAMRRNQDLRVLVASGYFDLATPFFGAENALSQAGLVHERISYRYYEVGHMVFLHEPSRVQFLDDVRQFVLAGQHCARGLQMESHESRP